MDSLRRAINGTETLRCLSADATQTVREACERQELSGVEAIVLGRAITCGGLLATLAKEDRERVRIVVQGEGPSGQVIVDAHGDGRVRACLQTRLGDDHPANAILEGHGRPTTSAVVGTRGHVVVTRDLGLARPYQGSVELASGEIDEDLARYLNVSEQLPSALTAAVVLDARGQVQRAGGILCQGFPGSDPTVIADIQDRFADGALRTLLERPRTTMDLIEFALAHEPQGADEPPIRDMGERSLRFHCGCGPENARRVLSTLGHEDLLALASEREQTEVTCHFCGSRNTLAAEEIRALAHELRQSIS
jgi:molecular chaperone Hsp33